MEEYVSQPRNTREYCEKFYRDYGFRGATVQGGYRPRMFNDLPESKEYSEAKKQKHPG